MPEAFAILFVVVVGVASWVGAWTQSRNASRDHAPEEIARLQEQASWLRNRLATAREEKWDEAMVAAISDQLGAATRQLGRTNSREA